MRTLSSAPPTIRTVAKRAGVGVGTVSRVLNSGPVSQGVRERVLKAISELGFRPHAGARSLAQRKSCTIGLVVNSTRGSWFSELIAGVEEALAPSRHSVVIGSLRLTGKYDPSVVTAWLQERRVDGLLFVRCSKREHPLLAAAHEARVPVALIAPDVRGAVPIEICAENALGGELAGRHLLELGHRRFAFVGGPRTSVDTKDRLAGLKKALKGVVPLTQMQVWYAPNYYQESGTALASEFFRMSERPTAIVCANDALALGFSKALLDRGMGIPEDVSLVGFDNSPESAMCWPGLTSIAQPSRSMAAEACRALLSEIVEVPARFVSQHPVELVRRQSSGPCLAPLPDAE